MGDRALLVGINAYPGQPLNGCVNDVSDMANFLVSRCHFADRDIRLVVDRRATTAAIKERLGWLLSGVEAGDRIFFHYSGHGTLFPVRNAQGQVTTVYDAICPVDFDWSREHAITSSDLQRTFSTIPKGTEFVFVSDSCNSGDLMRAFRQFSAKFLHPPADIAWRLRTAMTNKMEMRSIQHAVHDNCAFISGCRSKEESADAVFDGRPNGALTYGLLKTLNEPNGLAHPLTKLIVALRSWLGSNDYSQQPQLHGPDELLSQPFLNGRTNGKAGRVPLRLVKRASR